MASATRTKKQKETGAPAKKRPPLPRPPASKPQAPSKPSPKKPLPQALLALPKKMPGYSRYDFYPDGRVVNIATGNEIVPVQLLEKGYGFRLTDDKGKRSWVYKADVEALFAPDKEQPQEAPQEGRKTYYVRKTDKKSYKRLTKPQIDAILKLKEPKQVELAKEYGVSESTISRLLNQKTRLKSYYA